MAINWVRGFRRIGWVITFPIAAILVLAFYEHTKEFSLSDYKVQQTIDYDALAQKLGAVDEHGAKIQYLGPLAPPGFYATDLPGLGTTFFSTEIPKEVTAKIIKDFMKHHPDGVKPWELDWPSPPPPGYTLGRVPIIAKFTVPQKANGLRLAGLIVGSFIGTALAVQGGISVFAWIFRGFKG